MVRPGVPPSITSGESIRKGPTEYYPLSIHPINLTTTQRYDGMQLEGTRQFPIRSTPRPLSTICWGHHDRSADPIARTQLPGPNCPDPIARACVRHTDTRSTFTTHSPHQYGALPVRFSLYHGSMPTYRARAPRSSRAKQLPSARSVQPTRSAHSTDSPPLSSPTSGTHTSNIVLCHTTWPHLPSPDLANLPSLLAVVSNNKDPPPPSSSPLALDSPPVSHITPQPHSLHQTGLHATQVRLHNASAAPVQSNAEECSIVQHSAA